MPDPASSPTLDLTTTIEFMNTAELDHGISVDHLDSTLAALDWLQAWADLDPADVSGSAPVLARVVRARAAFRELWDAVVEHRRPDEGAVREINRVLRHRTQLEVETGIDDRGLAVYRLSRRFAGDPVDCALAELAEPLAQALGSPESIDRIRTCANDECRWVFFDASRTHRKRWCDMASCGNRAKAARHRARARAGETAPESPPNDA
jgi:predicted RNA-binding Zn ribbon-like protein